MISSYANINHSQIGITMVVALVAITIYLKFNRNEPNKSEGIILSKKPPAVLGLLPEFELMDQAAEDFWFASIAW